MLTNEKYVRHNIYNRHLFNLKKVHVVNPPGMWMEKEGGGAARGVLDRAGHYSCARAEAATPLTFTTPW